MRFSVGYLVRVGGAVVRGPGEEEHVIFIRHINDRQSVFIKGETDLWTYLTIEFFWKHIIGFFN